MGSWFAVSGGGKGVVGLLVWGGGGSWVEVLGDEWGEGCRRGKHVIFFLISKQTPAHTQNIS